MKSLYRAVVLWYSIAQSDQQVHSELVSNGHFKPFYKRTIEHCKFRLHVYACKPLNNYTGQYGHFNYI